MEKKIYQAPTLTITRVNTEKVMAASSINSISGTDGLGMGGSTQSNNITSGNVKANNYSVWDYDWSK